MGLTMQEKKSLTKEISKRYQKAEKKEKTCILNELVKTFVGYDRFWTTAVSIPAGWTGIPLNYFCSLRALNTGRPKSEDRRATV